MLVVVTAILGSAAGVTAAWDPNTDPSLVGWWKFDDGAGTTAQDSSGKAHNGTLQSSPQWAAGRFGGALAFNGSNYVQVNYAADLALNEFTVCTWVNLAAEPTESGVLGTRSGGEYTFDFKVETAQVHGDIGTGAAWLNTAIDITATDTGTKGQGGNLDVGTWYMIAYVIDNKNQQVRLYLDGDLKRTIAISGKPLLMQSGESMLIGGTGYAGEGMNGLLDDVRIYSRGLTTAEIKAMVPPKVKARKPSPADGAAGVNMPLLTWTPGETAAFDDIYIGTTPQLTAADRVSHQMSILKMWYHMLWPLVPGNTYYWRVDAVDAAGNVFTGDVWSFTMAPLVAFNPMPPDGAMYQNLDVDLAWTPGQNAKSHKLWFGTNKDDVVNGAAGADKGALNAAQFTLPPLTLNTTYYWRVDETDLANVVHPGQVWSFTTTIPGLGFAKRELWMNSNGGTTIADIYADSRYPGSPTDVNDKMPNFESPADIADNYIGKLSAWLHVPASGKYTFWVASDDNSELYLGADPDSAVVICRVSSWTNSEQWDKVGEQKSQPIQLEAGRYYLMARWKEGTGGDNCAAAWQGPGIPTRELISGDYLKPFEALWAYGPQPRNNEPNTTQTPELQWSAGTKATKHQIYFSDDRDAVANGEPGGPAYRGEQDADQTSFDAGQLEFNTTYYWRVDEVNPAEADSPWKGPVWSFSTADFIVVDTFESYTNDSPNRLFQTWIDGWGFSPDEFFPAGDPGNGTGASVGHDIWAEGTPYTDIAETSVVRPDSTQSMPLGYDNSNSPFNSEAERTWESPQNWTLNNSKILSLQVYGHKTAPATVAVTETGGKMSLTGSGADIWGTSDEFTFAYKTLSGDGSLIAKVVSNGTGVDTWAKGGVMIRDSLEGRSASAQMVMTGGAGNGAAFQDRSLPGENMTVNVQAASALTLPYWVKIERVGDTITGSLSSDGTAWTVQNSVDIVMTAPVYIGLCVTSHHAGEDRTFQFEGIKSTGGVSGQWQGVVIDSPLWNSAQDFYVVLQDSLGKSAVVTNAAAVNSGDWLDVQIPLSQFTGVNPAKIKKMIVGVGSHTSPAADGSGLLFIDDIRVIKATP
jgi:hypothetical protein